MSKIALCDVRGPLTDLIEKLSGESGDYWLGSLKQMLRKDLIIDCDAAPFLPVGWQVEKHIKGGSFEWDSKQVQLFLTDGQKAGAIQGHELRKELENQPVLNANVLDFLLAHPELIPESWKGKATFFWGTIYRDSVGDLCVRYLFLGDDRWHWDDRWLGRDFDDNHPAAVSASS